MNRVYTKVISAAIKLQNKNGTFSIPTKNALNRMERARLEFVYQGTNVSRTAYMKALENAHYEIKRNRKLISIMNKIRRPTHATVNAYQKVRNTHKKENYNRFVKTTKIKTPGLFR